MLDRLGLREEGAGGDDEEGDIRSSTPGRPIAFKYDFIEFFVGSSRVSTAALQCGLVVSPPLDISLRRRWI